MPNRPEKYNHYPKLAQFNKIKKMVSTCVNKNLTKEVAACVCVFDDRDYILISALILQVFVCCAGQTFSVKLFLIDDQVIWYHVYWVFSLVLFELLKTMLNIIRKHDTM